VEKYVFVLTEDLLSLVEKTICMLFKNFSLLGLDAVQSNINLSTF